MRFQGRIYKEMGGTVNGSPYTLSVHCLLSTKCLYQQILALSSVSGGATPLPSPPYRLTNYSARSVWFMVGWTTRWW